MYRTHNGVNSICKAVTLLFMKRSWDHYLLQCKTRMSDALLSCQRKSAGGIQANDPKIHFTATRKPEKLQYKYCMYVYVLYYI